MEKLFTFNKFFIGFCALLIAIVFAAKIVSDMKVAEDAKKVAQGIFQWDWAAMHLHCDAVITDARVIDRSETEAKVEVTAKQTISNAVMASTEPGASGSAPGSETGSTPSSELGTTSSTEQATNTAPKITGGAPKQSDCKAILTFYRTNNQWELGRVEIQ